MNRTTYLSKLSEFYDSTPQVVLLPSDREAIRDKIKMAYRKKAESFDELLDLCSALTEQHIYENVPTKLDYYKNGISCCKKIFDLGNELNDQNSSANKAGPSTDDVPKLVKRTKTQH